MKAFKVDFHDFSVKHTWGTQLKSYYAKNNYKRGVCYPSNRL